MTGMRAPVSDLPIVLQDACYRVRDAAILDGISLTLSPGAPSVLIGPNGSGKTTLLRLCMGLIEPTAGQVAWGGRSDVPPARRAIVFQRPAMLRRSAAANIEYALASAGVARMQWPDRVRDLLGLVGLPDIGGRPARRLSGGEQQRLALARALARDPEVLFLDEPTASLDPAATKAIEDVVRAVVARNIKVVMSTHDLGEARRLAGETVLLHRGRVVESGPAAEFFTAPKTEEARRFLAGELLV
jgi:tungstate transport system ATP-binding protein